MTLGRRIEARASALGISQSDLARRIGVGATTINGLIRGNARWTPYLFKIARHLQTSAEYLAGEIDDPNAVTTEAALPVNQFVMLPVALPPEDVLCDMIEGMLLAVGIENRSEAELARELAPLLPTVLTQVRAPFVSRPSAGAPDSQATDPVALASAYDGSNQ